MSEYNLKYSSYREYKEHRSRDQIRSSAKVMVLVGVAAAVIMSSGDEALSTQIGVTLLYMAFAFVGSYAIFNGSENRMYVEREFNNQNLDEEMYLTDGIYRTEVERMVTNESVREQIENSKNEFIEENKNRFGK